MRTRTHTHAHAHAQGAPNSDNDFVSPSGWEAKCKSCGPGAYNPVGGNEYCTMCPGGKYTKSAERDSPGKIIADTQCYECPAGKSSNGPSPSYQWDDCAPCRPGTYQPDAGATECLPCDGTTDEATTTCTPFPPALPPAALLGGLFGLQGQGCGDGECPGYLQRINQCLCQTCCPEVQTRSARMLSEVAHARTPCCAPVGLSR